MTSFYILNNRTRKKELESCDGLGNIDGKVSFLRGFFDPFSKTKKDLKKVSFF